MDGTTEYPLINANDIAAEAWAAMDRRDAEEALRLWAALRDHSPERPEGHIWPIQLLWERGRLDEAEAMAKTAFEALSDDPELLVQHAWIATSRQAWEEAAERWAKARKHAPERREGYVWGVRALWQAGRGPEADGVAAVGLARFPGDVELMVEHAWSASSQQQWRDALRRWTLVHEAAPERLDGQVRLIQALRMVGRVDDSETMAAAALAQNPDDTEVVIEHIWAAVAREDWKEAVARLDRARDNPRHGSRLEQSLGAMDERLRALASGDRRLVAAPIPTGARDEAAAALMLGFESLGERCDFGAVQRYFGVEPLGLLRFAWSRLDSLIGALDDRFEAVGSIDDTGFDLFRDETILRLRKYDIIFHTFVEGVHREPAEKQEAFRQQQRRRLLFLKNKLVSDLEEPQKICVYSTGSAVSDDDVARLFKALRAHGPNALLYVRPATAERPEGMVEELADGLYAGYFPGLTDFMMGHHPPFELWRELCRRTQEFADRRRAG